MEIIVIYTLLILNILSFLLGYLFGYIKNIDITNSPTQKNNKKINHQITNNSKIEIDDKKVVVSIDTKGLEKKYEELGDKKIAHNDISNSINKLKNLKG